MNKYFYEFIKDIPFEIISMNTNLPLNFIQDNINQNWNWYWLSKNESITTEFVVNNIRQLWCWKSLLNNPNIDVDVVCNKLMINKDEYMDDSKITYDWDFISKNKHLINFNWCEISKNPNITIDIVLNNDCNWCWTCLSRNHNMTYSIVHMHPEIDWNVDRLYENPAYITYDMFVDFDKFIIEHEIDKKCLWYNISQNPNLSWKNVKYIKKKKTSYLMKNKMDYDPYFRSDIYRKRMWSNFWEVSKEEFIARTWHPDRVAYWCLDDDDRKERLEFYGI